MRSITYYWSQSLKPRSVVRERCCLDADNKGTPRMPPKKKVDLPDHVREAVLADVELSYRQSIEFDENAKVRIFLATEQGLDTYELAEKLGISQTTASKYARQGKEAHERREQARSQGTGDDPHRPGEREPVS